MNLGNEVIIPLSATGELCLYTSASIELTVDVAGYVGAESPAMPTTPARFLDTRSNGGTFDDIAQADGQVDAGSEVTLAIASGGEVPADAVAAIVNITAVRPERRGFVMLRPRD